MRASTSSRWRSSGSSKRRTGRWPNPRRGSCSPSATCPSSPRTTASPCSSSGRTRRPLRRRTPLWPILSVSTSIRLSRQSFRPRRPSQRPTRPQPPWTAPRPRPTGRPGRQPCSSSCRRTTLRRCRRRLTGAPPFRRPWDPTGGASNCWGRSCRARA